MARRRGGRRPGPHGRRRRPLRASHGRRPADARRPRQNLRGTGRPVPATRGPATRPADVALGLVRPAPRRASLPRARSAAPAPSSAEARRRTSRGRSTVWCARTACERHGPRSIGPSVTSATRWGPPRRWRPSRPSWNGSALVMAEPVRVAVVGSGFGGLAAAIRLQAAGLDDGALRGARSAGRTRLRLPRPRASRSTPGPTVITAPHCLEELFARRGPPARRLRRAAAGDPVLPAATGPTATASTTSATRPRMLAQIARRAPRDVAGYRRFVEYSAPRVRDRLRGARGDAVPALRGHGRASRPSSSRLRADRSVYRTVARFVQRRAPAPGAQLPLAAGRRQPVRDERDLHADPLPRAAVGRLLPARRHRRAGARAGARCSRTSAASCGSARRSGASRSTARDAAAPPASPPTPGARALRSRGLERRPAPHLRQALRRRSGGAARRPHGSSAWTGRCRCSSSTSAPTARWPDLAHHTVLFGPRYRELLRDIFHGPRCPRTSASTCTRRPSPTRRWRRRAASASMCSRPVPHLGNARRSTGSAPAPATPTASWRRWRTACSPTCAGTSSPSGRSRRAISRRAGRSSWLGVLARAAADPERLVPAAQPGSRASPGSTWSAPGRTPAPACPGSSTRPRPRPPPCMADLRA